MKTHTTVSLDMEVLAKAKELGINVSGMFNDYLKVLVLEETRDVEGVNLELLNTEIQKEQELFDKHQAKISQLRVTKKSLETKIEAEKEEALRVEKEKLEQAKKCVKCGNLAVNNPKKFPKGTLCNPCYRSMSGMDLDKFMDGADKHE